MLSLSFPCSDAEDLEVTECSAAMNLRLSNLGKLEDPERRISLSKITEQFTGRAMTRTQLSFLSIILSLFSVNLLHSFTRLQNRNGEINTSTQSLQVRQRQHLNCTIALEILGKDSYVHIIFDTTSGVKQTVILF